MRDDRIGVDLGAFRDHIHSEVVRRRDDRPDRPARNGRGAHQHPEAAPIVVGVLSVVGLVAALIGDGWWDALSWLSLTLPVLLYFFFVGRRSRVRSTGE